MSVIEKFITKIEHEIVNISLTSEPQGLYAPVNYVLALGGKRIRPALCLTGCALFNDEAVEQAVPAALGLEIFHNFTLLHDDIMDGAAVRRNNPTVHEKWDANTAILSGDAMLIKAYQYICKTPAVSLQKVLEVFSKTAMEVCEGQQYDMEFETRNNVTQDEYLNMIRLKTSVLLGASLQIGAIIAQTNEINYNQLYKFGTEIGISFQLQDDWLDVFGDDNTFGKAIGGDIVANKKTFLLINAFNNLSQAGKKHLQEWINKKDFNRDEKITAVRNLYDDANVSNNAKKLMDTYYKSSLEKLNSITANKHVKEELALYAHQLMERSR